MTPASVGFVLLLSLVLACGGGDETGGGKRSGEPPPPLAPVPSRWADEADDRPHVGVAASVSEELLRGTPLVIEVSVLHPQIGSDAVSPLRIAAAEGAWSNALHVEIADEHGALQNWPLQRVSEVSGPLTLDAENGGSALFTLSPEQSAALVEGAYEIRARLDTREAGEAAAWKGEAASLPAPLRVAAAPPTLTPEQERSALFARARYQLALGESAQAEAEIDALLRRDPSDQIGLLWKGDLLESAGRKDEALASYEKAIEAYWVANPDAEEPPTALLVRRDALLQGFVEEE